MPAMARTWTVGVDAGGTWLRVLAENGAGQRWTVTSRATRDIAASLRALWRRRRLRAPNVAHLVVATRGVWTPNERRAAVRRLGGLARRVHVLSDVEAAYRGAIGARAVRVGTLGARRRARAALRRRRLGLRARAGLARRYRSDARAPPRRVARRGRPHRRPRSTRAASRSSGRRGSAGRGGAGQPRSRPRHSRRHAIRGSGDARHRELGRRAPRGSRVSRPDVEDRARTRPRHRAGAPAPERPRSRRGAGRPLS